MEFTSFFAYVLNACGSPSLVCVAGNYLLIHLKESGEAGVIEGASYGEKVTSIKFAEDRVTPGIVREAYQSIED